MASALVDPLGKSRLSVQAACVGPLFLAFFPSLGPVVPSRGEAAGEPDALGVVGLRMSGGVGKNQVLSYLMGGWWSGLCGRFAALAASAFGVGSVSAATGGIRSGGMMMGLSGGRSGVYGGGEAKIANRSLAAASSARADAGGVHPLELSLDAHMLVHVFDASLSGDSDDESGWPEGSGIEFPWRSNHVVDAGGIGASSAVSSASGGCVVHVHACLPCGVNCHPGWLGNAGALCHACEALSPSAGWSQPFLCCHDVAGYVVSATVVVESWACQ